MNAIKARHLLEAEAAGLHTMREFYTAAELIPTSNRAREALVRSHIAYWSGARAAERADVRPSRGHSFHANDRIVRFTDEFDHREGVVGWR